MEYKNYRIVGDGTYGMYELQTIGRGSLPKSLRGSYSTPKQAQIAIDMVVAEKADKDGKSESTD